VEEIPPAPLLADEDDPSSSLPVVDGTVGVLDGAVVGALLKMALLDVARERTDWVDVVDVVVVLLEIDVEVEIAELEPVCVNATLLVDEDDESLVESPASDPVGVAVKLPAYEEEPPFSLLVGTGALRGTVVVVFVVLLYVLVEVEVFVEVPDPDKVCVEAAPLGTE